ncbi:MAG: hypothetical protein Ct9H300mP8_08980 [Gammaproteobacteria bacterium]|nr:MAG: hypothetical protein Ct9H300mP8_08980 [Gammaproteobacteria bacterium]
MHDPIWATLEEARVPFILHVGSAPLSIEEPWMNDGRPDRTTARGGAEVIGSKDLTVIHHAAQRFISTLVLDGVLEQFPALRGGVIEIGAGWVPDMIRRLDYAADIWSRSEPHLAECRERRGSRSANNCALHPILSNTWINSSANRTPSCTYFRPTTPTQKGVAIRSDALIAPQIFERNRP